MKMLDKKIELYFEKLFRYNGQIVNRKQLFELRVKDGFNIAEREVFTTEIRKKNSNINLVKQTNQNENSRQTNQNNSNNSINIFWCYISINSN